MQATLSRICGGVRLGCHIGRLECNVGVSCFHAQQYRQKSTKRFKAPPVHAEKEKRFLFQNKKSKAVVAEVERMDLKPFAEDDVWMQTYYQPVQYDLIEAIQMHREFCQPAMLNAASAKLHLTMMLDLRSKKKTKFMNVITKTLVLPHDFVDGAQNRVMVFVKDEEGQKIAAELGATFVGGTDLVKMIEKGEIHQDDFDHVVCHVDMLTEITAVRKFLRDHFPHKNKGNLGGDIRKMVTFFTTGKTYESEKLDEALGRLKVTLGTLDMSDEQLMENHETYIESICSHRSAQLGPFVTKGTLTCPPSPECFLIDKNLLRPPSQRTIEVEELQQDEAEVMEKEESDVENEQQQTTKKVKQIGD